MKQYIYKISLLLACGFMGVSCIHDKIDDLASIGKKVPTVYWEKVPEDVTAGDSVKFELQYYPMDGKTVTSLDVYYGITVQTKYSASCPILSTFKYEVTNDTTQLVREFMKIQDYVHSQDNWSEERNVFSFNGLIPTAYTLRETEWKGVEEFDQKKFKAYFPANFENNFRDSVYSKLQAADFRKILTVTNPRIDTDVFESYVDTIIDPNKGPVEIILPEYVPMMKEKFYSIPYDSLFYDATTSTFKLEYEKVYSIGAKFMVTDSEGAVGYGEQKTIKLH